MNELPDIQATLDGIEIAMVLLAMLAAGSVAALVGGAIERWIIRPIGKRRGWYE